MNFLSSALANQDYNLTSDILNRDSVDPQVIQDAVTANIDQIDSDLLQIILDSESVRYDRALTDNLYQIVLKAGRFDLLPAFANLIEWRSLLHDVIKSPDSYGMDVVDIIRAQNLDPYRIDEIHDYAIFGGRYDIANYIEHYFQQ